MKVFIHKSLAVLLAFVVITTTMSFTIDMHYCGNKLVDFSFVQQAKTCGMEMVQSQTTCENPILLQSSCCSDEQVLVEGQHDLNQNFIKVTIAQKIFVASFIYSYRNLFEETQTNVVPFVEYPPPRMKRDVQVLHQSFLI